MGEHRNNPVAQAVKNLRGGERLVRVAEVGDEVVLFPGVQLLWVPDGDKIKVLLAITGARKSTVAALQPQNVVFHELCAADLADIKKAILATEPAPPPSPIIAP